MLFEHHLWAPFIGIVAYLSFPKTIKLDADFLKQMSIIHNTMLILFSAWTFVGLVLVVLQYGIVFSPQFYFQIPQFKQIIFLFYVSKYYEFFDTFLLYFQGKPASFLQKFHHVGAVLCWHLCYTYKVDAVWMPSLWNAFVHTIMYTYYLGCLMKWSILSPITPWRNRIKRLITRLQLLQFFVQFVVVYLYFPPNETWFNFYIILFVASYGIALIYLFMQFYKKTYS
jgi:hypothetical protein